MSRAGKAASIRGVAVFLHQQKVGSFQFNTVFDFPGSDIGLQGNQAGPLHASLKIRSPVSVDMPRPEDINRGLK